MTAASETPFPSPRALLIEARRALRAKAASGLFEEMNRKNHSGVEWRWVITQDQNVARHRISRLSRRWALELRRRMTRLDAIGVHVELGRAVDARSRPGAAAPFDVQGLERAIALDAREVGQNAGIVRAADWMVDVTPKTASIAQDRWILRTAPLFPAKNVFLWAERHQDWLRGSESSNSRSARLRFTRRTSSWPS